MDTLAGHPFCELSAAWEQHLCGTEGLVAHIPGQD